MEKLSSLNSYRGHCETGLSMSDVEIVEVVIIEVVEMFTVVLASMDVVATAMFDGAGID